MASTDSGISDSRNAFIAEGQPSGGPESYQFTREELQVLRDCNREAFYSRSLPMAATFAFGTHMAVKGGYLKSHPRWGSSIKVTVASFLGYFLGKFSYQTRCIDKIMQLESSPLGDSLRKRKGIIVSDKGIPSHAPPRLPTLDSIYSDPDDHVSSLDVDFEKNVQSQGLDDSQRPSIDGNFSSSIETKQTQEAMPYISYEDLRKSNREQSLKKESDSISRPLSQPDLKHPPPSLSPTTSFSDYVEDKSKPRVQRKNKYGDVWED